MIFTLPITLPKSIIETVLNNPATYGRHTFDWWYNAGEIVIESDDEELEEFLKDEFQKFENASVDEVQEYLSQYSK